MKIAIVHGYFLNATGSNLYVRYLSRQFCLLGHDVILICQERNVEDYDFIESCSVFDEDNSWTTQIHSKVTAYKGKCRCYVPYIGSVLPVYVENNYDGFEAREITKLTGQEIENYIEKNSEALKNLFAQELPELIISNHLVLQPAYVKRAIEEMEHIENIIVMHGSSFNFSVKKSELALQYAIEGIRAADKVVFLTDYSMQEFSEYFDDITDLRAGKMIIPAGVGIDKFMPLSPDEKKADRINRLLSKLELKPDVYSSEIADNEDLVSALIDNISFEQISRNRLRLMGKGDHKRIDRNIREKLLDIDWENENILLFFGKYLWTKGIHNLILAFPFVLQDYPDSRLIIVGFGTARGYLEALVYALDTADKNMLKILLARPQNFQDHVEPKTDGYFRQVLNMLADEKEARNYLCIAKGRLKERVIFTGFMDHNILSDLIPCADVAIAPSIFPEAFGMVGIEALACGVFPIQTYHSGFKHVVDTYADLFKLNEILQKTDKLWLNDNLVWSIAGNIRAVLESKRIYGREFTEDVRKLARAICEEYYSWESVAVRFINIATNKAKKPNKNL